MRLGTAAALAAALFGCDGTAPPEAPPPAVTSVLVRIDDVCGPGCIDLLEARLARLDGVRSARVLGYDRASKSCFALTIAESRAVVPETFRAVLADLKRSSNGDDDFGYLGCEMTSITGTVAVAGDDWTFTARGSGARYDLVPDAALQKLVAAGRSQVTISGRMSDEQGRVCIEISDAK